MAETTNPIVNTPGTTPYQYRVLSVPEGCTTYEEEQIITLHFTPPPPTFYTLNLGAPCNGIRVRLTPA